MNKVISGCRHSSIATELRADTADLYILPIVDNR